MFFSISIPVYNAEKYLDRCINSIINQSEKDYEIILVDDGSTDNSVKVCEKWVNKYPSVIKLIKKENSGSLFTRRRCLLESRGDYIYIADADDYLIDKDALKKIRKTIENTNCDLVFFNYTKNEKTLNKEVNFPFNDMEIIENEKLSKMYEIIFTTNFMNQLWNKVFKRDLVDWDRDYSNFKDVCIGTDIFQSIPILTASKKMVYLDEVFYYYRTTEGSIVHKFNNKLPESMWTSQENIEHYSKKWNMDEKLKEELLANRLISAATTDAIKLRLVNKKEKIDKVKYLKRIREHKEFDKKFKEANLLNLSFGRRIIAFLLYFKLYYIVIFITNILRNNKYN